MTEDRFIQTAQIGFIIGACAFIGFSLMELAITAIMHYMAG